MTKTEDLNSRLFVELYCSHGLLCAASTRAEEFVTEQTSVEGTRYRGAEGAEGVESGRGVPSPADYRESGGAS